MNEKPPFDHEPDARRPLLAQQPGQNPVPFPGERLHRLLDDTYDADLLPPLPKAEGELNRRECMKAKLGELHDEGG